MLPSLITQRFQTLKEGKPVYNNQRSWRSRFNIENQSTIIKEAGGQDSTLKTSLQ